MGRAPCCDKVGLKKGRWTDEEDKTLIKYIEVNGEGSWKSLPKKAGLLRCGKSCRLRWINYLRADLKRGNITEQEEDTIVKLHASIGNRWSVIASHLPGRTDNEIKNYWNSHLSRKIYRFYRPGREPCPPPPDILKIPSPCKRGSGRVSRSVAKKFNKNIIESTTEPPASDDTPRGGPLTGVDNLWPNDRENEVMGPFNFEELDEQIDELSYILENGDGAEDSCGNLNLDVEIENAFVGLEELKENGRETKGSNGGGGSSCDNGETYGLNSGFMIDNEWIDWHLEYAAGPDGGLAPCPEEENNFCLWDKDIHEPGEVWHY